MLTQNGGGQGAAEPSVETRQDQRAQENLGGRSRLYACKRVDRLGVAAVRGGRERYAGGGGYAGSVQCIRSGGGSVHATRGFTADFCCPLCAQEIDDANTELAIANQKQEIDQLTAMYVPNRVDVFQICMSRPRHRPCA